jgi:hypothetical protein
MSGKKIRSIVHYPANYQEQSYLACIHFEGMFTSSLSDNALHFGSNSIYRHTKVPFRNVTDKRYFKSVKGGEPWKKQRYVFCQIR